MPCAQKPTSTQSGPSKQVSCPSLARRGQIVDQPRYLLRMKSLLPFQFEDNFNSPYLRRIIPLRGRFRGRAILNLHLPNGCNLKFASQERRRSRPGNCLALGLSPAVFTGVSIGLVCSPSFLELPYGAYPASLVSCSPIPSFSSDAFIFVLILEAPF